MAREVATVNADALKIPNSPAQPAPRPESRTELHSSTAIYLPVLR
jgi:hypothetical protein